MPDVAKNQSLQRGEIERRLDDLPMLPMVVANLARLDPNSEGFSTEVRKIAESDPPLAVRVLAAANCAASAPITAIMNVENALTRLGAKKVARIVTSLAVMRVFVPTSEGQRNLWHHALQVAIAAKAIANEAKTEADPGTVYLMGLLHDIGRFVMFEHDPMELDEIDQKNWQTPSDLVTTERELCGFDHADLGATACKKWELPDNVVSVIEYHHAREVDWPSQVKSEIRIIQIADRLSCLLMNHPDFTALDQNTQLEMLGRILGDSGATPPPISVQLLASLLKPIQDESFEHLQLLGLR